jgi:tetratricopeptide (TPR) repeat protein
MNRYHLAIPAVSFLALAPFLQASPQTNPNTPQTPPATAAAPAAQAPIDDEQTARLMIIRKQYAEAEAIFRRLTREQPKNAVYWNELGISMQNQALLGPALKCYEKATRLNPKYADPQNNIGTIWYERKKYPKAIRAYKKAILVRDDYAAFYMNLGFAYFGQQSYEDSITSFRKALQIDPSAFDSNRTRMGTVIQDRSISSDRGKFYFLLAKSFAESGNVERCVIYLRKARDEGYKDYAAAQTDPSFAAVVKDPAIQEILSSKPPETAQP